MKLVFNVIDNFRIIDKYEYSSELFLHNDKTINIDDKNLLLVSLISKTANWESNNTSSITRGFYVEVLMEDYYKQYYFEKDFPSNFTVFLHQIRKIALGG